MMSLMQSNISIVVEVEVAVSLMIFRGDRCTVRSNTSWGCERTLIEMCESEEITQLLQFSGRSHDRVGKCSTAPFRRFSSSCVSLLIRCFFACLPHSTLPSERLQELIEMDIFTRFLFAGSHFLFTVHPLCLKQFLLNLSFSSRTVKMRQSIEPRPSGHARRRIPQQLSQALDDNPIGLRRAIMPIDIVPADRRIPVEA